MVPRGEAAYGDHTYLNELQAHHFDPLAVKAPKIVSTRTRDRGRFRISSTTQPGNSKSFGKHCYKWNEDSSKLCRVQLRTRVYCVRLHATRCPVPSLSAFPREKSSSSSPASSPKAASDLSSSGRFNVVLENTLSRSKPT